MSCERDNRCNWYCDNEVGGTTSYPCQKELRALERCLKTTQVKPTPPPRPRPRPCRCCCCCCCCWHRDSRRGNQTTWGR